MEITCGECGSEYDPEEESINCPDCGFGPEKCSHPMSYRDSRSIYSVDEGTYVQQLVCSKCGAPL